MFIFWIILFLWPAVYLNEVENKHYEENKENTQQVKQNLMQKYPMKNITEADRIFRDIIEVYNSEKQLNNESPITYKQSVFLISTFSF